MLELGIKFLISYFVGSLMGSMIVGKLEKLRPDVWADGTVLRVDGLPPEWRERFASLERDPRALPLDSLRRYEVPEVAPEYHERLAEEWRSRIRDQ